MNEYNSAFFNLYENWFKAIKSEYGEEQALKLFRKVMETGLEKAYGDEFVKGNPDDFANLVGERDKNVGLHVSFPVKTETMIVYRFHTDPFPNLKNEVKHTLLDDTYIAFKVQYLLGDDWNYESTAHLWNGDKYTEFTIIR